MDKLYILALGMVPGVGSLLARQLLAYFGSAKAVFEAPKGRLMRISGIGETISSEILKKETLLKAELVLKEAEKHGARLITIADADYPTKLKEIPDAPLYIYWQGNASPVFERAIAIVGTRQATEYGKSITENIVSELVAYKPIIVSGFAYGIDIVAHKTSMKSNLPTIAVLGGGLGKIYPALHKKYVKEVEANGAMVSEYAFDTEPLAMHFPARNRIVAGLVDAVIVVEAAEKGGALITAEIASSYDREVFAVPGNIGNKLSEGCNKLIKNNVASIFTDVKELASVLNWEQNGEKAKTKSKIDLTKLSQPQVNIYTMLAEKGEMNIDDLSWKSQMNMNQLASVLLEMELQGWVKPLPGKKFKVV